MSLLNSLRLTSSFLWHSFDAVRTFEERHVSPFWSFVNHDFLFNSISSFRAWCKIPSVNRIELPAAESLDDSVTGPDLFITMVLRRNESTSILKSYHLRHGDHSSLALGFRVFVTVN